MPFGGSSKRMNELLRTVIQLDCMSTSPFIWDWKGKWAGQLEDLVASVTEYQV